MKNQFEVDHFKKRTLRHLHKKQEDPRIYPIDESDLIKISSCPICKSSDTKLLTELYFQHTFSFFSTNVCEKCVFTYRSVSPALTWFKKCWKAIATNKLEVFNQEVEKIREQRYSQYFQAVTRHINPSGICLDIGAAYGTGARIFQDGGFAVEAIEAEDNKRNYIENILRINVIERTVEDLIEKSVKRNARYHSIIMAHCLEHFDDPINVLINVREMLHPEGVLYIEVPTLWDFVTWSDALFLTHKSNFTQDNLRFILSRIGFNVLEKITVAHGEGDPLDLGFVLQLSEPKDICYEVINMDDVEKVKRLYRKGLGFNFPSESVLKYNVEAIEHFYQTILLDSYNIIEPQDDYSFIEFKPTSSVSKEESIS